MCATGSCLKDVCSTGEGDDDGKEEVDEVETSHFEARGIMGSCLGG